MKNKILNAGMILSATLLMLSGCASDDTVSENNNTTPARLSINVVDGSFASADNAGAKTRSTDTDYGTTFTNGDAIGVFAVTTAGAFTVTNEKYTYNGSKWLSSAGDEYLPYSADTKYFAYYPYDATLASTKYTATGISASTFAATDFFAGLISGWTPSTDQSTHDKYTAQDLMVSMATVDGSTGYTFSMAHQMALMEMDFAQILLWKSTGTSTGTSGYKYRFESHTPYDISGNGKYRLLVKPSTAKTTVTGRIYSDATTNSGAWYIQETSPAASNYKVYKYNSEEPSFYTCVPAVGSLYNSDGTCTNKMVDGKTPIGVVVSANSTNSTYCESGKGYGHGLVMALTDAHTGCYWGNYGTEESLDNKQTLAACYGDVSGLTNTKTIAEAHTLEANAETGTSYPAFYYAYVGYKATVPAPAASSGWFLPSMGQWWVAMEESVAKNGITSFGLTSLHNSSRGYYNNSTDQTNAYTSLNKLMSDYSRS